MSVSANVDDYANARLNIYFPGVPQPTYDYLTGQCVSLVKWFLGEMCDISDWQSARGNAKDFGDTLVAQGLAIKVNAGERKRGDIVVWKQDGGGYGHIGVLCSNDNVFEENVGLAGTPSQVIGDNTVYASRLDPLYANWRKGSPTFYRVNSYVENQTSKEDDMGILQNADNYYSRAEKTVRYLQGRTDFSRDEYKYWVGKDLLQLVEAASDSKQADQHQADAALGELARKDNWQGQIYALQDQVKALQSRPSQDQLADLQAQVQALAKSADQYKADNAALVKQQQADTEAGQSFLRRIGQMLGLLK